MGNSINKKMGEYQGLEPRTELIPQLLAELSVAGKKTVVHGKVYTTIVKAFKKISDVIESIKHSILGDRYMPSDRHLKIMKPVVQIDRDVQSITKLVKDNKAFAKLNFKQTQKLLNQAEVFDSTLKTMAKDIPSQYRKEFDNLQKDVGVLCLNLQEKLQKKEEGENRSKYYNVSKLIEKQKKERAQEIANLDQEHPTGGVLTLKHPVEKTLKRKARNAAENRKKFENRPKVDVAKDDIGIDTESVTKRKKRGAKSKDLEFGKVTRSSEERRSEFDELHKNAQKERVEKNNKEKLNEAHSRITNLIDLIYDDETYGINFAKKSLAKWKPDFLGDSEDNIKLRDIANQKSADKAVLEKNFEEVTKFISKIYKKKDVPNEIKSEVAKIGALLK